MYERIELTITIIMLRNKVKWAQIREGCCVVFTSVSNNVYNSTGTTI